MHLSAPRTRYAPSLNAARSLEGTVSRFLASRVCSKVPLKANAHVRLAKESVDPRWRMGRSPATPDRLRNSKVPHFLPLRNTIIAIRPTGRESDLRERAHSALRRGLTPAAGDERSPAATAGRRAAARIARVLAVSAVCRPVGVL